MIGGANGLATKNKIERGRDTKAVIKMPTKITLSYTATACIHIPNNIAKKLKGEALDHYNHEDDTKAEPWSWFVKWDDLYYYDDDMKIQKIECGDANIEIDEEKWPHAELDECYTSDEEEEEED